MTSTSENRTLVWVLGGLLATVTVALGAVLWTVRTGDDNTGDDNTEDEIARVTETSSDDPEEPQESGPDTDVPFEVEAARELDQVAEILVRGDTPQGWTIETDGLNFYPVGPAGPETFTDTESTGFTQTPEGAGLAAIHITQRISPAGNPDWETTIDSQVLGDGVDSLRESLAGFPDEYLDEITELTALKSAWVGWNVISFDPNRAEVQLVGMGMGPDGVVRYSTNINLEWIDGDWRVITEQPSGQDLVGGYTEIPQFGELDVDMTAAYAT